MNMPHRARAREVLLVAVSALTVTVGSSQGSDDGLQHGPLACHRGFCDSTAPDAAPSPWWILFPSGSAGRS